MSVSILEVIESAGYDLSTVAGAEWLAAQEAQFDELIEAADELIEEEQERLAAIQDAEMEAELAQEAKEARERQGE